MWCLYFFHLKCHNHRHRQPSCTITHTHIHTHTHTHTRSTTPQYRWTQCLHFKSRETHIYTFLLIYTVYCFSEIFGILSCEIYIEFLVKYLLAVFRNMYYHRRHRTSWATTTQCNWTQRKMPCGMALPICVLEMLRRGMRVDIYSYIYIYIYMHICCILRLNVANDILVQYMCIHTHIHVARVVIYICTCIYIYEYVCAVHTYIVYKYIVGDMEAHDNYYFIQHFESHLLQSGLYLTGENVNMNLILYSLECIRSHPFTLI